ncbi:MAG: hypothetical protein HC853_02850 [Anaerolineae bacterium]|nr:hypothetical protein [Anaerolineae bacterium]
MLRALSQQCALHGIRRIMFNEPDDGMGHTALCTELITGPLRKVFGKLRLWGIRALRGRVGHLIPCFREFQ